MKASALVTGGSGGLGTAVVAEFLGTGWRVVVPWIEESELGRLPDAERLETVHADLFEPDSAAAAVSLAAGSPDDPLRAVVNLVGGFAVGGRVHETPVEEFERQVRLNIRPAYLTTQAALPRLMAGGGGAVVLVSSRAALRPFRGAAGYVTGKAAVLALTDALAVEYAGDDIRVNAVIPSVIDTPANRAAQPGADYSSWVAPESVARVIHFLCEDSSGVVSGAHIPVYGSAWRRHEAAVSAIHAAFAGHHKLPFTLLSDKGCQVRKSYGVPAVLGLLPGRVTGARRHGQPNTRQSP